MPNTSPFPQTEVRLQDLLSSILNSRSTPSYSRWHVHAFWWLSLPEHSLLCRNDSGGSRHKLVRVIVGLMSHSERQRRLGLGSGEPTQSLQCDRRANVREQDDRRPRHYIHRQHHVHELKRHISTTNETFPKSQPQNSDCPN